MTSSPRDLLLSVTRDSQRTLGRQIEDQLRSQIRDGSLRPDAQLPSTRDLATQLGVSRPIVVAAYEQLAAEGLLVSRPGARPRVASGLAPIRAHRVQSVPAETEPEAEPEAEPRLDFRPGIPDLAAFPRGAWLRATRDALRSMPVSSFGYTEPHGALVLRQALSDYLARVRGVVSDPSRVLITSGWAQGRTLLLRALKARGAQRVAIEDPCFVDARAAVRTLGLTLVPVPVDEHGMQVASLDRLRLDAVIVTPAHQYPSGVLLSGERRAALLEWVRRTDGVVVEDDYDAEYRYDRAPVGALQSLDPERIVYAGSASKTMAPGLRLGWLVAPPKLAEAVRAQQTLSDFGVSRIEQAVFAEFFARGDLDRHLRRMRGRYRARRNALVKAVERWMPGATVQGIAAGLHAVITLPEGHDEAAIMAAAAQQGIGFNVMGAYHAVRRAGRPATLVLGYARNSEAVIVAGIRELSRIVRATTQA